MKNLKFAIFVIVSFAQAATSWACPIPKSPHKGKLSLNWSAKKMARTTAAIPPFGGGNSALWSAEAMFANAGEKYLKELKEDSEVRDVWVSIPLKIEGSHYFPFGDAQSNSRIHFPDWKDPLVLPYMAALIHFRDPKRKPEIEVRLHPAVKTKKFRISILNTRSSAAEEKLFATGNLSTLNGNSGFRLSLDKANERTVLEIFSGMKGFWISGEGWKDGFPIVFKTDAWRSIGASKEALFPSLEDEFKGLRFFSNASNIDPQNLAAATAKLSGPKRAVIAFEKASWKSHQLADPVGFITTGANFGRFPGFPAKPAAKSNAVSVHGEFKENFDQATAAYTSVGGVITRYALKGQKGSSVKHLYTCFTARTPDLETVVQPARNILPGVPSGAGWHKVGDPAETVLNTLESSGILSAISLENPFGGVRKSEDFSYHLDSVATLRWTQPGEAFVTSQGEHHWYAVHDQEWPVCTEILVHDCVPQEKNGLGMKCL